MSLILHIVRKDFRRLRWPLAGWLVVVMARLGIGFSLVLSGGFGAMSDDQLKLLTNGLLVLGLLLTFVLTAMLVQEDSLVGETQFWLTRPISGTRLLTGKLAGWFFLLWLPAFVVTLPWWLTCGFGVSEIFWAGLEMFALQLAVSAPAALVAVVTDTLSRFLLWTFVLVFALGTTSMALATAVSSRAAATPPPHYALAGLVALVLTAAGVVVRQYRRRDVVRSVVWLGVGAAMSVLVTVAFPKWLTEELLKPKWSDWHAERASGVKLVLSSFDSSGGRDSTDGAWLHSEFEVRGVPSGLALDRGASASQTWRWPGGPVVRRDTDTMKLGEFVDGLAVDPGAWDDGRAVRSVLGVAEAKPDPETEQYTAQRREALANWRAAHPAESLEVWDRPRTPAVVHVVAEVFPSTVARIRRMPPAYEASVQLRLLRPELWLDVPLKTKAWRARFGHGIRVFPVNPTADSREPVDEYAPIVVRLVASAPEFFWDVLSDRGLRYYQDLGGTMLYFVHRAGGDVQLHPIGYQRALIISSVDVQGASMMVWRPTVRRGDKWMLRDAHWVDGATVAVVGFPEEARFTAEVKAERYEAAK